MANITRASLDANTLTNFPDNNSNYITPALLRAWLDDAVDSFVTQKDKSTLENAIYENEGSALTASASINLASASGNYLHITGAFNGVNSFGICPAGARFILVFDGVCTLTDSATLVLPGGSDITTAAGDCAMLVSEGSGSWRMVGFFPISGGGGGGDITAVNAGTGLSGGGTSGAVTLNLDNTAVTPNSYTNANITVDQQGRITAASSGTSGGVPGGADTEIQYNNAGAFGGIPELTYSGGFVQIETPKIGTGNGNGHLHIHSANSAPTGITNYLTTWWEKATRVLGFRSETDTHETYIQLTAPTADRTITLPDASGNVVIDTIVPSFSNGASAGEIRFKEAGGSNYVALKAASSLTTDTTFTLPNTDGTLGTVLQTNGSGVLSWVNNGGATTLQYLKNTTATSLVSPASNTILESLLIPGGTFKNNDAFVVTARVTGSGASNTGNISVGVNTSLTLAGIVILQSNSLGTGVPSHSTALGINLYGGISGSTTRILGNPWTANTSVGTATTLIDWSVNQFLIYYVGSTTPGRTYTNVIISTTPV